MANSDSSAATWSPEAIRAMVVVSTGCLCMLLIVAGTMLAILRGTLNADLLGSIKGVGIGSGILGLALVVRPLVVGAPPKGGRPQK